MPRYYLQGTGATCYDRTGVTFPERLAVDWQAVVGPHPADRPEVEWRRRRDNQPEELTFAAATRREAEAVVDRLHQMIREAGLRDTGFIVTEWPAEELVVFAVAATGDPEAAPGATVERAADDPAAFAVTDKISARTEEAETLTAAILRAWELTTGERPGAAELVAAALGEVEAARDQAQAGSARRTELATAAHGLRRALEDLAAAGAAGEEGGPGMEVLDLRAPQLGPGEGLWRYIDTGGNREYGEIIGGERDGMKVRFEPPAEPRPEGERPLTYAGSPFPGAVLTGNHATSSYGRPVLVIDGNAFGPEDLLTLPDGGMIGARDWVRLAHRHRQRECRDEGPLPAPWGEGN